MKITDSGRARVETDAFAKMMTHIVSQGEREGKCRQDIVDTLVVYASVALCADEKGTLELIDQDLNETLADFLKENVSFVESVINRAGRRCLPCGCEEDGVYLVGGATLGAPQETS